MNEQNYNTNIEKSILSSIVFEPRYFDELSTVLRADDFFLPSHQDIYSAISSLVAKDKPIDEEFLKKELQRAKKLDEVALLGALTANPIGSSANLYSYVQELRTDSINRQMSILGYRIAEGDFEAIAKLQDLKEKLLEVGGERRLKKREDMNQSLRKFDMNPEVIENIKFEYLYDDFMVKNEITMIAARPGSGKSLSAFALCNMLYTNKKISSVYYLDGDNGKSTLKQRSIHKVKQVLGDNFMYFEGKNSNDFRQILKELKGGDLRDTIVVFDSIKNFMQGGDRDKNKDVSKVMETLKALRNNGATVIFLHHSNKPQKDINELMYAGSSAWEEDTGNAYILKKNEDKGTFIFSNIKKRTGDLQDMAFTYDATRHWLFEVRLDEAKQTKEDEEMIEETIEFLKSSRSRPMWSELSKNLTDLGFDKEKAAKIIKNNEGTLWKFERGDRNNQKLYSLIETSTSTKSKVIETVYEDISNSAPISPRSLFLGISDGLNVVSNKSDKSKDTLKSGNIAPITPRTLKIGLCEGLG